MFRSKLEPLVALVLVASLFGPVADAVSCTYPKECKSDACLYKWKCVSGKCGEPQECICNPCYRGKSCDKYVDNSPPRFLDKSASVQISDEDTGKVYQAEAQDADRADECPSIDKKIGTSDCPCGFIEYSMVTLHPSGVDAFVINVKTGEVSVARGIATKPGDSYTLEITATGAAVASYAATPLYDSMTLTVNVESRSPNNSIVNPPFAAEKLQSHFSHEQGLDHYQQEQGIYKVQPLPQNLVELSKDVGAAKTRQKRSSAGTGSAASSMKLSVVGTDPSQLIPGQSVNFNLSVVLPTLTTAMDLLIEIFVMDAVTGITPMTLCDVKIVSIGDSTNKITDNTSAPIPISSVSINMLTNTFLPTVQDRAIINFGKVLNSDVSDSGTNKAPSTIIITFTATLIINTLYTNTTAIVTAGAEYDSSNYVWVCQASYTFSMSTGFNYPSNITMTGPTTANQYGGASFHTIAYITDPMGPFTFEVYTPTSTENQFSVSTIVVQSIGSNLACSDTPSYSTKYRYSVDRTSYYRGIASFQFSMKNLQYPTLVNHLTNTANKVEITFSVFFMNVNAGDVVSVGAGIVIGSTTLWTSSANLTISAAAAASAGTATFTSYPLSSSTTVAQYGTLTWAIDIFVPSATNANVACTAAAGGNKVFIRWGNSGSNIAFLPFLNDNNTVIYNSVDGATSWTFNLNSTGQLALNATFDNTAQLEVSVMYLAATAPTATTITCNGNDITLTPGATLGSAGTTDMTGTAQAVNPADKIFYLNSQQALIATLTFKAGGATYSNMVIESSSDFDVTTFGALLCRLDIMDAGNAVPAISGNVAYLNSLATKGKISAATSKFNDAGTLTVGPVSAATRNAPSNTTVTVRMTYMMPKNQTITSLAYNMSMGIKMSSNLIWTGWDTFTTSAAAPTAATTPIIVVLPPTPSSVPQGIPTMIKIKLKTAPGSVNKFTITASFPTTTNFFICRILLLHVGTSYPCVDQFPYGKEKTILYQPTTIIHNTTNWGLSAVLDLGVLRNVGYEPYYASSLADSDSIVVGVVVKGITPGASETLKVVTAYTGGPNTAMVPLTVTTALTPAQTLTSTNWVPQDGTSLGYSNAMKFIDFVMTFPPNYDQSVTVTIGNGAVGSIHLCNVAVAIVGNNLPCVIPNLLNVTSTISSNAESFLVDLQQVCYYGVSPSILAESQLVIRIGVQFNKTGTAGSLTAAVTENAVPIATQPSPYSITLSPTPLNASTLSTSSDGFSATLVNNETTVTSPGQIFYHPINIVLPPSTSGLLEVGVIAPTDGGRAYATAIGFRWGTIPAGRNIGCVMDPDFYTINMLQNSSLTGSMIHTSQTDTMVINLGIITNTGVTYLQQMPVMPDDNTLSLEVGVMMADHLNATNNAIIPISIAVKFGDVIFVAVKNLQIVRAATTDLMALKTYINFTTPVATPIFDRTLNNRIPITIRMWHDMNISRQEANDAILRVLLPRPVQFVNLVDTQICNITSYTFTNNQYLDFAITALYFTDWLEINVTVTVDPNNDMVKGLGVINAAILARLVCTTFTEQTTYSYCGTTAVLPFQINGTECYNPLNVSTMVACQFSASTAIDATTAPFNAKAGSGSGWSPAVRSGPGWSHSITIDFLRKTRVTQIGFNAVTGNRAVTQFMVQYSNNGFTFIAPCTTVITVVGGVGYLPTECKFEARYGRLIIVDTVNDGTAIGVNFEWYGCNMDNVSDVCTGLTTAYTDTPGWRQIAYDAINAVFYFCDYSPKKMKEVCFSTTDRVTWNALPAYIGMLIGTDATTATFYAKDIKGTAFVTSKDGVNWLAADATVGAAVPATAVNVPGNPANSFGTFTVSTYTADFTGILYGGAYIAKWETCCS